MEHGRRVDMGDWAVIWNAIFCIHLDWSRPFAGKKGTQVQILSENVYKAKQTSTAWRVPHWRKAVWMPVWCPLLQALGPYSQQENTTQCYIVGTCRSIVLFNIIMNITSKSQKPKEINYLIQGNLKPIAPDLLKMTMLMYWSYKMSVFTSLYLCYKTGSVSVLSSFSSSNY